MDNQQPRQFSTRFLSTGIPEYNALLDTNLGKRREFLLGNRQSLELMQQTGVIERVEAQSDNPNQYVVHIAEKPIHRRKRLPPRSTSGPLQLPESQTTPWRHNPNHFDDKEAAMKANVATLKGLSRSFSSSTVLTTSCKPVLRSSAANRLALFGSTKCSDLLESSGAAGTANFSKRRAIFDASAAETPQRSRSAVPAISAPYFDDLKAKSVLPKRSVTTSGNSHSVVKGTVEHLLESDAAFMTQIRQMKDQLAELETTKANLDTEIGQLRRKLRGVNAVRENDVAVAHCSSIMQHRLSKAEEEYMKLVTQQQEVKKDVDRVRRELLSLRKVRHKLQEDIEEVAHANQSYEEKIHASKITRNQLSEELNELERCAEVELEDQRLSLPPEDAVVVDVAKLMGAVQERNTARRHAMVGIADPIRALAVLNPTATSPNIEKRVSRNRGKVDRKSLLDYCTAFRVLQNSLGFINLTAFEHQFTTTEEQLLSKYKANLALADEVAALEKELSVVTTEKKTNRANVRGVMQANEKVERGMHMRIQATLASIKSYNELRELRNREHAKLRGIMLRCLDALQIDEAEPPETKRSSGNSNNSSHSLYWTETQSPELLEMLQRKMTQVAVTLKLKHSSRMRELPPEALRLNRGHDGRRSNMFSTREASKIVLGPRQPTGSALAAILGTVQPPSVENAVALTESVGMNEVLHGLHRTISPARRKASFLSLAPPELGKLNVPRGSATGASSTPSVLAALIETGGGERRRSNSGASISAPSLAARPSLAVMTEDTEDESDEEVDDVDGSEDENASII